MQLKKYLYILFISICFTSCYTYRSIGLIQEDKVFLPKYEQADYEDYRIRVNDELLYRLITTDESFTFLVPDATSMNSGQGSYMYRVMEDGTIDLPFVRAISVAGLTIKEATAEVERRFKEILPDATVKLALNKTFTVIGEVSSGIYPIYKEKMTIYQALAMTGDITNTGDRKHVKILRKIDNETQVLEFDIRPASVIKSEYYYIYPNDIVYVQRSKSSFFKVTSLSGFLGLINTTITLFATVYTYTKLN